MNLEEQLQFKQGILQRCFELLEQNLADLKSEMDDAQKAANEYGPPKDRYDAFRNQQMRRKDMMAQQYQKALDQKDLLGKIDPEKIYDRAVFGALVETDHQLVFISVSLGKISYQGTDVFVISPQVPFFSAIGNKKRGEQFEFRGQTGKVLSVC